MKAKPLSSVQLLATPGTAAYQAPPSLGFSRREYWSGVPSPSLLLEANKQTIKNFLGTGGESDWKTLTWVYRNEPLCIILVDQDTAWFFTRLL